MAESGGGVVHREGSIAGAGIIARIICMVDVAHRYAILSCEVIYLPGKAVAVYRTAFQQVGVPLSAIGACWNQA